MSGNMGPRERELRERIEQAGGAWRELARTWAGNGDLPELQLALERLADGDSSMEMRYKARSLSAALGMPRRPERSEVRPPVLGSLAWVLNDIPPVLRLNTLESFAAFHGAEGADELAGWIPGETDPMVLASLVKLLGSCGRPGHIGDLKPLLRHGNLRVVANTVEAMGRLDGGTALPMVLPLLMADDHRTRANVLLVVCGEHPVQALAYISRMATHTSEAHRAAALWCLTEIRDSEAADVLVTMLSAEPTAELRDKVLTALGGFGSEDTILALARLLVKDPRREPEARRGIDLIARRLELSDIRLRELMEKGSKALGVARISRSFRRLSRSLRAAMITRSTKRFQEENPGSSGPSRRLALLGAGGLAIGVALTYTAAPQTGPEPTAPGSSLAGIPSTAAPVRPASPAVSWTLTGVVRGCRGPVLLIMQKDVLHAVRYPRAEALRNVRPGQTVTIRGRYRAFNRLLGYVELDGESVEGRS